MFRPSNGDYSSDLVSFHDYLELEEERRGKTIIKKENTPSIIIYSKVDSSRISASLFAEEKLTNIEDLVYTITSEASRSISNLNRFMYSVK